MTPVCDFIHRTTWHALPAAVQRQATRCLLDTIGVAVAGRVTPVSRIMHDYVAETFARGPALLWQDGRCVAPPAQRWPTPPPLTPSTPMTATR